MESIRTIIIDDETHARSVLKELLLLSAHRMEVVASCADLLEGIAAIKTYQPQVVFLDVQMPNYAGYEIVDLVDEIDFEIIFVTAYDQYAIKAFELHAIDYLLKPIDRSKLSHALDRLREKLDNQAKLDNYHRLLNAFQQESPNKLVIPELNNRRLVNIDQIIAVEAAGAYTKIHQQDGKVLTTSKNLKFYEERLEPTGLFFRSHRSWLVQLNKVIHFNRSLGMIAFNNQLKARISRKHYEAFEQKLISNNPND